MGDKMARVIPLFSGSKGNSYYIGSSGEGVLIDAGRSCKQLEQALELCGVDIKSIGGIFITHEHIDHCSALNVFAKKYGLKIYASQGTLLAMEEKKLITPQLDTQVITEEISTGNMLVRRQNTPHDARESCCYQVTAPDGRKAAIATDMGVMTRDVRSLIEDSDFAVVESNYDPDMLKWGSYPPQVKRRILSDRGHLSNTDCSRELENFVRKGVTRLMLGHISENNNLPDLALNTSLGVLASRGMKQGLDFTLTPVPVTTRGEAVVF